jgi:hypothetical protein
MRASSTYMKALKAEKIPLLISQGNALVGI